MKLIIAGGRNILYDYEAIHEVLIQAEIEPTIIISGGAAGIDKSGEQYAQEFDLDCLVFDADWELHGRAAGPIRNRKMAEAGDALLLIWDGKSRGSSSMKKEMERLKKPIIEIIVA